jgi:hypothetical protein
VSHTAEDAPHATHTLQHTTSLYPSTAPALPLQAGTVKTPSHMGIWQHTTPLPLYQHQLLQNTLLQQVLFLYVCTVAIPNGDDLTAPTVITTLHHKAIYTAKCPQTTAPTCSPCLLCLISHQAAQHHLSQPSASRCFHQKASQSPLRLSPATIAKQGPLTTANQPVSLLCPASTLEAGKVSHTYPP